jgi:hypothetical protein
MSGNRKGKGIDSTINTIAEIVQAIPLYDDALKPAVKQMGQSLETVTRTINMALSPLRGLVWGYEHIESWLTLKLAEKFKKIAPEKITTPSPQIAGPAIESLRYVANNFELRDLYANLFATAMNIDTMNNAHPGYNDILRNLIPDEAILLKAFVDKSEHPTIMLQEQKGSGFVSSNYLYVNVGYSLPIARKEFMSVYVDNLCRLGVLIHENFTHFADDQVYDEVRTNTDFIKIETMMKLMEQQIGYQKGIVRLTPFGTQFIVDVVADSF